MKKKKETELPFHRLLLVFKFHGNFETKPFSTVRWIANEDEMSGCWTRGG